jgi:predicted KAP-like P-loop ATPase
MAREILKRPGFESDYHIAAQLNPQFDLESRRVDAEQLAQNQQNQGNTPNQNPPGTHKTILRSKTIPLLEIIRTMIRKMIQKKKRKTKIRTAGGG